LAGLTAAELACADAMDKPRCGAQDCVEVSIGVSIRFLEQRSEGDIIAAAEQQCYQCIPWLRGQHRASRRGEAMGVKL
jgi:hypothetical protein